MIQIFFFTDVGNEVLRSDDIFRRMANWHAWGGDGSIGPDMHFGVAHPLPDVNPQEVIERLEQLGVTVLPSVHDADTEPHEKVFKHLEKYGIKKGHKTHDVAKKMHEASGFPPLRPHKY